jgi:Fe-S cluster biogenesis protein NfuA
MITQDKKEIIEKVQGAIDSIRPYLIADGGDVSLVEITDDLIVKVKLSGACDGCPFSYMTLKAGIEQSIRKRFPDMKELVAVT